ncbi:MAG TPA: hypothetical protein VHF27_09140 [Acidimicrobiales bacterium]|nr:hypothetical protein [Acidimicrobiales bacterium]
MHRRISRRWLAAVAGAAAAAGLLLPVSTAWAPHVAQLQVTPTQFRPGDTVTVFGPRGYGQTNPVEVRWDAIDGPVLGSFRTVETGFAMWGPGTVTIPADATPGIHTMWATQKLEESEKLIRGLPAKMLVQVLNPDGSVPALGADVTPQVEPRPTDLVEDEAVGTGALVLAGLGVAGVAMFAAGAAALMSSRRRPTTPETVRGSRR